MPNLTLYTPARVALGRAGSALPTQAHLQFQLAHGKARDAVNAPLDFSRLEKKLKTVKVPIIRVVSRCHSRDEYIKRPDLGRKLSKDSRAKLKKSFKKSKGERIVFVLADGLSPQALEKSSVEVLKTLFKFLKKIPWALGPVVLAEQGRVALGDEIGSLLKASLVVTLIGERPGLSSPESLGAYLTYRPKAGLKDADRNCVSNIGGSGLSPDEAALRIGHLIQKVFELKLSGVLLKDDSAADGPKLIAKS